MRWAFTRRASFSWDRSFYRLFSNIWHFFIDIAFFWRASNRMVAIFDCFFHVVCFTFLGNLSKYELRIWLMVIIWWLERTYVSWLLHVNQILVLIEFFSTTVASSTLLLILCTLSWLHRMPDKALLSKIMLNGTADIVITNHSFRLVYFFYLIKFTRSLLEVE